MNVKLVPKNISEIFSKILFATFYVLLLVEFFAILYNSPSQLLTIFVIAAFFLLTLFSSYWGLWLFVAAIPLINGFSMMKGLGDISLVFVGVYLAWFPKQLFRNKSIQTLTVTSLFANLLAVIILLNLCLVFVRIIDWPIPSRFWIDWFTYFPFVNQKDNLWQINAALILLKGIFLFRMIDLEVTDRNSWIVFTKTIYVQAVFIAGFSLFQFVLLKLKGFDYLHPELNYLKLYLPFNDIHSYGSYAVLLFGIFACLFLQGIMVRRVYSGDQPDGEVGRNHLLFSCFDVMRPTEFFRRWSLQTYVNGSFAFLFLFFCLYSFSRMTWLVAGIIILLLVITVIKNKKLIICTGAVIVFAFLVGSLSAPKLFQSDNPSLYRFGSFLNVKNISQDKDIIIRCELWERSLAMVKDYPLTGVGIGNFYRNNVFYENRYFDKGYLERQWSKGHFENAHNYYLQMATELGVPGVLLFIFILLSLYLRQIYSSRGETDFVAQEISVKPFLYGLGAYLLTMLTGHPLLLSSQQLLFWAVVAIIVKGQFLVSKNDEIVLSENKFIRILSVSIFFLFVFGFSINLSKQEPKSIPVEYGLYSTENWNGTKMRWMAGEAEYYIPETTKKVKLVVVAQPYNSQKPDGLTLTISINDVIVDIVHFVEGGLKTLSYEVMSVNNQDIKVNLEVDKVFYPRKIELNDDFRSLGVAFRLGG